MPKFLIMYIGRDGTKVYTGCETIQEAIKICKSLKNEGSLYNVYLDFGGNHYREILIELLEEGGF